ncbi:MAG: tRNA (adenosine(37)-N6)-threonylcarbamoyltransferase complex dimerization subunit type 1 TsaB [Propionibacteriaceae bacterium]|jgi:tRNA threonylcarbamoyl adenosine modification protein YeaZ|nr:tRNA (adenosine(37)-N6)-threonylcarbamoyltransferase complex dimerization subunit type 1 TsaB [Propionibacteriaceae bacterium]
MAEAVVLGLDTAWGVSVGLAQGGRVLARAWLDDSRRHVESLAPLMAQVLAEAGLGFDQVDRIVVGMGPGPFTGLRVGVVAARTWAAASCKPISPVCSLDVLALAQVSRGDRPNRFVAALDARRRELYWAEYDQAGRRLGDPRVSAPADLPDLPLIGPGALLHPEAGAGLEAGLARRLAARGAVVAPVAENDGSGAGLPAPDVAFGQGFDLARAGDLIRVDAGLMAARWPELPPAGPEPLYLRRPDAIVPGPRKSALPTAPAPSDPTRPATRRAGP